MTLKPTLLTALLVLAACAADEGDDDYLGNNTGSGGQVSAGSGGQNVAGMNAAGTGGKGSGGTTAAGTGGVGSGGTTQVGSGGMGSGGMQVGSGGMGSGGMQVGSGGMGSGGASGGNTMGTVTVEFTTVSYGGEYEPLNYGAVWFERADGTFIKTAKRWAGTVHASDLVAWTEASGGWGSVFGGGNMGDMADAVSSATIREHEMHTVTWNMNDADKKLVPDGAYVAVIEMSESRARDGGGKTMRIEFTKGPSPQTVEPEDMPTFTGIALRYEP